jgi:aminoglycoside 6'-N-acetyltransferase Ib
MSCNEIMVRLVSTTDSVTLRLMTEHDLPMLHEWLNRPHIVECWGGEEARPSLEEVKEQYLPSVMAEASVIPYIAMTDPGVRGIVQTELLFICRKHVKRMSERMSATLMPS